jgi:hypothetical protein
MPVAAQKSLALAVCPTTEDPEAQGLAWLRNYVPLGPQVASVRISSETTLCCCIALNTLLYLLEQGCRRHR